MRAIIFAAGKSSRLGELTKNLPKSCLNLFNKSTILDFSLKNIHEAGFEELVIVTGHAHTEIEKLVERNWSDKFKAIKFIYNEEYANKNNYYTAYLIKELLDNQSFIFNSDIVYDARILQHAVESFKNKKLGSFLLVDDQKKLIDEDMKIRLDANKIIRIHKEQDNTICAGEYIGILHLEDQEIIEFKKSLQIMVDNNETDKYYEDALDRILDKINLSIVSTQGYSWAEIDTSEDYQRAKELECVKLQYQTT